MASIHAQRGALAIFFVLIVAVLSACASKGPRSEVVSSLREHVDDLDSHRQVHDRAVTDATSAAAIVALEDEHRSRFIADHDAIRGDLDELSKCLLRHTVPLDTSRLHDALQDARAVCERHDMQVRMAADVAAMKAEEELHRGLMDKAIASVRAQSEDLLETASSTDCRPLPH